MRYELVKAIVATAMYVGMLLSLGLWRTERHYPHAPVWDALPTVPAPWDLVVYFGMLLLLAVGALALRWRWPLLAFVALAGTWSLWDQSRWQPWFYQYLFMLAALGLARDRAAGLNACRLVMAATYIWSGIQKVNFTFATDIYPWILEPVLPLLPEGWRGWVAEHGWNAAYLECGLGVCLLVWPLRIVAVPLLVGMHGLILYCLSPRGHDWNTIVWPWNAAMMALNVALFVRTRDVKLRHIVWPRGFLFGRVVLVLFGVMPLFSFFGWWDSYLSAALYSGNTLKARIEVGDAVAKKLPAEVRENHLYGSRVSLSNWSIEELNVPPYPARRVYRAIARRLAALDNSPDAVTLDVEERPDRRTGERAVTREEIGP